MERKQIQEMAEKIREQLDVFKIVLYNQRTDFEGNITSFKICVVVNQGSRDEAERKIYMEFDIPVPYDVLVYTREEWERISKIPHSFAMKIEKKGYPLYE